MSDRVGQGGTIQRSAVYEDSAGMVVDPVAPLVSITDANGTVQVADVAPVRDAVGRYHYDYHVSVSGALGVWEVTWAGTINGVAMEKSEAFIVVPAGDIEFPSGVGGALTCAPWAGVSDLCAPCGGAGVIPDSTTFQVASDVLFELSGRQFPGLCTRTVRPDSRPSVNPVGAVPAGLSSLLYGGNGSFEGGNFSGSWDRYAVQEEERTGGSYVSAISLGVKPVVSIQEVKIDGKIIDPATYVVHDHQFLVRRPGPTGDRLGWPVWQRLDLPDTEVGTFSVTVTHGRRPPLVGVSAAAELACQLATACSLGADDCQLPERVTQVVRQGVTMLVLDPTQLLESGRTGLYTVDLFLTMVNPKRLRRRAAVITPDRAPAAHRQTWP